MVALALKFPSFIVVLIHCCLCCFGVYVSCIVQSRGNSNRRVRHRWHAGVRKRPHRRLCACSPPSKKMKSGSKWGARGRAPRRAHSFGEERPLNTPTRHALWLCSCRWEKARKKTAHNATRETPILEFYTRRQSLGHSVLDGWLDRTCYMGAPTKTKFVFGNSLTQTVAEKNLCFYWLSFGGCACS